MLVLIGIQLYLPDNFHLLVFGSSGNLITILIFYIPSFTVFVIFPFTHGFSCQSLSLEDYDRKFTDKGNVKRQRMMILELSPHL